MSRHLGILVIAAGLLTAIGASERALAQKQGGVLRIGQYDSPASMSIHEESSNTAEGPMMGVFNNLVLYDQHEPQNSLQSIRPDLATDWSWDEDRTRLTFHLRQGVSWHDGKPFTAQDVECTWDLLRGKSSEKLRLNPRKAWYRNLRYSRCWPRVGRRSIPATSRRAICATIRSARAPSNSSNSSPTK